MQIKIVIGVLCFLLLQTKSIFAEGTIFPIESYSEKMRTFSGSTEVGVLQKRWLINKAECEVVQESNKNYLLSPSCLVRGVSTGMSVESAIDLIMPYVQGVPIVYNTASPAFSYEATTPIFSKRMFPMQAIDSLDYAFIIDLQKQGSKLRVSPLQLAYLMSKSWSWYGVWKDMTALKPCTKQNYYVAFDSLQDYVRAPGSELNINDILSDRGGYCKGTGPKNLMFYGGVCGFATQLFRLSLLMPSVDVVERYGHSQWYVPYYSDYVFGDDAALYQNSKKLIIKNNLPTNIYLKTLDFKNSTYLIAIVPQPISSYVEVKKEQVASLKGRVTKTIKTKKTSWVAQEFVSIYTNKAYVVR